LHLAAEGKAAKTVRTYTEAVQWFAAAHLLRETDRQGWDEVSKQDVQRWIVWLLKRYSSAYASNQYRALQQFFKWLAAEDEVPDPMAGMRPPHVPDKPVPVFTGEELPRLERACAGREFQQRRDAAVIAVFRATGIRLSELAGIRYDADDPQRSDVDRHAQAHRPQLWLGVNNRGPLTVSGIYQVIARRGRECDVDVFPHRFRHHFSHTWLDRGGPEGDLMELNGWTSPQMVRRYGASARSASARSARARRTYDRVMDDSS
jgi:integrase/recombinase XerD